MIFTGGTVEGAVLIPESTGALQAAAEGSRFRA